MIEIDYMVLVLNNWSNIIEAAKYKPWPSKNFPCPFCSY